MNQTLGYGARCETLMRPHERCWLLQTAGRWPWKSESAKECVTTHLPKQLALKMDGAPASSPYPAAAAEFLTEAYAAVSRRVAAGSVEGAGREPAWSPRRRRSWW